MNIINKSGSYIMIFSYFKMLYVAKSET